MLGERSEGAREEEDVDVIRRGGGRLRLEVGGGKGSAEGNRWGCD